MKNSQILDSKIINSIEDFLEDILSEAKQNLDPLYTDCIIFTQIPNDAEIITLKNYLQPERILAEIKASPEYQKTQDLRIAASVWTTIYCWATLPGILTFMTWAGVGLNASLENVSFVLENGKPKAITFHDLSGTVVYPRRAPIPIPKNYPGKIVNRVDDLHQAVFTGLFQQNLAPLINQVHQLTKLSKKTMWGNAVNASEEQFSMLSQCTDQEAIKIDYSVLYEQRNSLVMPGLNPLYNLTDTAPNTGLKIRRTCCLYKFIPPEYENCSNCPLINH